MRRLSKIIMATGGIISMLAMCCLDSDGITCTTPEQSASLVDLSPELDMG